MAEMKIASINYKPNIRILSNYIISFIYKSIELFDHKGFKLDSINCYNLNEDITDICIIHNNHFIAITDNHLMEIYINNNKLEVENIILGFMLIIDNLYIKIYNLFIISYQYNIKIFDINSLQKEPIQTINNTSFSSLLYWKKDSFIIYNKNAIIDSTISLFQINRNNYIELISKFEFINNNNIVTGIILLYKNILKLDDRSIMIEKNNYIYLMKIPKMNLYKKYDFCLNLEMIKFINKIEDKIFIFTNNKIFIINYNKNELNLKQIIDLNDSNIFNHLSTFLQKKFNKLNIKIKIDWVKNIYYNKTNYENIPVLICGNTGHSKTYCVNMIFSLKSNALKQIEIKENKKKKKSTLVTKVTNDEIQYILKGSYKNKNFNYIKNKKSRDEWKKVRNINLPKKYKKNYR